MSQENGEIMRANFDAWNAQEMDDWDADALEVIDEEMYHQVATFRAGRMVRIEYFGQWSEALEAAGLSE